MSDWVEIDKEIIKFKDPVCFFEDNFDNFDNFSSKIKQIDHLPDTKEYLRSLEKKLDKIKGTNSTAFKSKDLIASLVNVRQDTMCHLLTDETHTNEDHSTEITDTSNDETAPANGNYLEKKIHPGI